MDIKLVLNNWDVQSFQQKLFDWYDKNKRDLPWRKTKEPYHIWVSEIMLQQTRVEAVKEFYLRFIKELPTVQDLANVKEDKLLKLWQGLGYYNRAKYMQQTAQIIVKELDNKFPTTKEKLEKLKGIGDYTSSAIASIAFDESVAVVDGNILRVFARIFQISEDISTQKTKQNFSFLAQKLLPNNRVGDFNQAIMELGAIICLPNGIPFCEKCPLKEICLSNQNKTQLEFPIKTGKKQRAIENKTIFIIQFGNEFLLHKRTNETLLANLWEFHNQKDFLSIQKAKQYLQRLGFEVKNIVKLTSAKHIFTHKEWHMTGYYVNVSNKINLCSECVYATKEQIKEYYSIPTAFSFYKKFIENFIE